MKNSKQENRRIIYFLKGRPLCVEILKLIVPSKGLTTSDISKSLKKSLSTVNTPLRDMVDEEILVSEKKGRCTFYRPKNRSILTKVLTSNELIENQIKLTEFYYELYKMLKNYYKIDLKRSMLTQLGDLYPYFVVTAKSKKIIIEMINFSRYNNLGIELYKIYGQRLIYTQLFKQAEDFNEILILLLPQKRQLFDIWKIIYDIESMCTDKVKTSLIYEFISSSDLVNPFFIRVLTKKINDKIKNITNW